MLRNTYGTTGYCGGDTGHGGRTYFSLEDLGCTDMTVFVNGKYYNQPVLEIVLGGDTELETFIDALTFAAESLKVMSKE